MLCFNMTCKYLCDKNHSRINVSRNLYGTSVLVGSHNGLEMYPVEAVEELGKTAIGC